ncbi:MULTISPECIES: flagellar export chaperone FliS [Pseudomonas]|jgi:flagellar protein FliS|uniref:Flagellar secretion chaperone FliS n=1 Tax=Pseudomonas citronellolis TaxID=53408 RepID=A0A1A9K8V3_9PSED|nr:MULTISPECIES: flagellar export chaperone FliS [Pseudomonas]ANI13944.1 flagellar export chaperone FliS [Pseudomonas citronellolis]KSW26698.1 flagellar export chaperone FliS [Pseudomonas sp. ADP]OBP09520.1 flagellar export chaperone FliS [Pseudomonas sp. EGD-AKN5]QOF83346.1 flagellar export chaperone FliS [Pseudomonas sp. ADPe]
MNAMAALRQYQSVNTQSQVHDASPHRLIQMLMEGGLSRIAQAKGSMERGQFAQKGVLIAKTSAIIAGLREALNFEAGGELAQGYANLYDYMTRRLGEANRSNDVEILDEVSGLLRTIKDGWDAIPQ